MRAAFFRRFGGPEVLEYGELPDPALLAVSLAGTLVVLLGSYRIFKRRERHFADVV